MKGRIIIVLLLLSGLLLADALKMHDDSNVSGDAIEFSNGNFKVNGKDIDRVDVKKVLYNEQTKANTDVNPEYEITAEKIAEFRKIAKHMEGLWPEANGYILENYDRQQLTSDGREITESHYAVKVKTQD